MSFKKHVFLFYVNNYIIRLNVLIGDNFDTVTAQKA